MRLGVHRICANTIKFEIDFNDVHRSGVRAVRQKARVRCENMRGCSQTIGIKRERIPGS
jgi:hypothetical protein